MTNQYFFMGYYGQCIFVIDSSGQRFRTAILTGHVNADNETQTLESISALIEKPPLSELEILAILYPISAGRQFEGKPLIEWKNKKLYHRGNEVLEDNPLYRFFVKL